MEREEDLENASRDSDNGKYIDPKTMIEELSIETFNHNSDQYYKRLALPEFQLGKPFSMPGECPQHLVRLGLILEELKLGPGMKVLDFGAGTCWISKALWQMGCDVVAVDVSEEALSLGRRLFEEYPIPMKKNGDWDLKLFDGHTLPLEDGQVERILCYDTFHHVPNQETIVKEFYRVLSDGGVIALNEPIGAHSRSEASQREMRDYGVLENDLEIAEVVSLFERFGFESPRFKVVPDTGFSLDFASWNRLRDSEEFSAVNASLAQFCQNSAIMYFRKGAERLDSRNREGLAHEIEIDLTRISARLGVPTWVNLNILNCGRSIWLKGEGALTGKVNVGTQLIDPDSGQLLSEHARFPIPRDIYPGESLEMKIPLVFHKTGHFCVRLDMVSEIVCWFQELESTPIMIDVTIED